MNDTQYRKQILSRTRQAILERDSSYRQIAIEAGIAPSVIYKIMTTERRIPSTETLGKLCRALGKSADWVLGLSHDE